MPKTKAKLPWPGVGYSAQDSEEIPHDVPCELPDGLIDFVSKSDSICEPPRKRQKTGRAAVDAEQDVCLILLEQNALFHCTVWIEILSLLQALLLFLSEYSKLTPRFYKIGLKQETRAHYRETIDLGYKMRWVEVEGPGDSSGAGKY
jgi:hypothetical protein